MSRARKCDICGGYFDQVDEEINGFRFVSSYENGSVQGGPVVDLCPTCRNKIKDLIREIERDSKTTKEENK